MSAVLCGALAVAGCSSTERGNAQPSTSVDPAAATAALWDPCSQISDGTLVGLGLKPSSEESGIFGVEEPGWKICRWTEDEVPANFSMAVYSTVHALDEIRTKPGNVDFKDVTVAGRSAVQYRDSVRAADEFCLLAFATASGFVQLDVINRSAQAKQTSPCDRAKSVAEVLVPLFPK
ncbi:DUF3558 domain-containing protein [Nocardia sp. NPDC058518]|uniref:DUF3558 domain-containing protein n=1 Tax=Nocardia sp. NPDC058518 TaxID=3346534 RepID=UPI0036692F0B